jgi:hypothetical protein
VCLLLLPPRGDSSSSLLWQAVGCYGKALIPWQTEFLCTDNSGPVAAETHLLISCLSACWLHHLFPLQMMLKKTKGLTWPMLLFALATTLVYMGGLAALQHRCAAIPTPANAVGSGIFGRAAFGE